MRVAVPAASLIIAYVAPYSGGLRADTAMAAAAQPPSPAVLAQITNRGKLLAEYDDAAWKATDSMIASGLQRMSRRFFARKQGNAWWVVFGRTTPDRKGFLVDYEATWAPGTNTAAGRKVVPPRADTGEWLNYSKAVDKVLSVYKPEQQTNYAVLPASNGYYVYFYPGSTEQGTWLLGGDYRFLVSRDLSRILETRQLHKSIIPYSAEPGKTITLGYHTAVIDNVPEDTDVLHVLSRRPAVPELVVTHDWVFKIFTNGSIRYMGTAEDLSNNKLQVE